MKSIKEKADEYTKEYLFSPVAQRAPNIHFEAGANYVLECIEEVTNICFDEELRNVIRQLKK